MTGTKITHKPGGLSLLATSILVILFQTAHADPATIAYQEGKFNLASQTLEPSDATHEFYLGKLRLYGYGLIKNTPLALQYFTHAANKGYLPAEQFLARYSLVAENDPSKALTWFKKAAEQGDTNARLYCAAAYLFGYGTNKNPDIARRFYIDAARDGSPLAQYALGSHFLESKDKNSKKLGLIWLTKSANNGDAQAKDALGEIYAEGKLLPPDPQKARSLFEEAAQQGLTLAMIHLGELAQSQQKYEEAKSWFLKANTPPNADASLALASLYLIPNTPLYQPKEAFFLTLSVAQNKADPSAPAALALAKLYAQGIGTPVNKALADEWTQQAQEISKWQAKQPTPQKKFVKWLTEGKSSDLAQTPYQLNGILTSWKNLNASRDNHYNQQPDVPTVTAAELFKPNYVQLQPNQIPLSEYFDSVMALRPTTSPTLQDYPQYPLHPSIAFFKDLDSFVIQHNHDTEVIYPDTQLKDPLEDNDLFILLGLAPANQMQRINFQHALLDLYNRAILSDAAAQFELGQLYHTGIGVAKNINQAITYYELAATQQEIRAEYNLGLLYLSGQTGTDDVAKGLEWLTDAAFKGNAPAQYVLGSIYQRGLSDASGKVLVEANSEQSQAMYYLASANQFGQAEYQLASELVKQNPPTFSLQAKLQRQHFIQQLYQDAVEQGNAEALLPLAFYLAMSQDAAVQEKAFNIAHSQAESGDKTAALLLGMLYDRGIGVAKNSIEALNWYEISLNHPVTAFILGTYASQGNEGAQNLNKAKSFLTYASEQHLPYATYNLAMLQYQNHEPFLPTLEKAQQEGSSTAGLLLADYYLNQANTAENLTQAKNIYASFAEKGDQHAATKLGYLYDKGMGTVMDPVLAEKWYQIGANQNQPTAQFLLGQLYQSGKLSVPNYPAAKKWFDAAAKLGNPNAAISLGFIDETIDDNYEQARAHYLAAATKDNPIAQYNLGLIKAYGKGQAVDNAGAFTLFQQAALSQHPKAMTQLAHFYLMGIGTDKNPEKAKYWLEEAAKKKEPTALYELGVMVKPTDPKQAFQYFEQAMLSGNEEALMSMADQLLRGDGVPKDENRAIELYTKAANNHHPRAALLLANIYSQQGQHQQAQQWLEKAKQDGYTQAQALLGSLQSIRQARVSSIPPLPMQTATTGADKKAL